MDMHVQQDIGSDCLLLRQVLVKVLVTFVLPLKKLRRGPCLGDSGAGKTGLHKGRCHMVDGIGYCAGSKLTISQA